MRRYVHIGDGQLQPVRPRASTPTSGSSPAPEDLGEDVADLFNHLTGFARPPRYRRALVAPAHLRDGIIAEIERAVAGHTPGSPVARRR